MKVPQIYILIDPISNDIRYVGKTIQPLSKRLSSHYKDKHLTYKTRWIKSLGGLKPIIKTLEFCDESELNEREIYWISHFRSICKLTNITDGGDGLPIGFKHTKETKNKISIAGKRLNDGNFKKGHERINKDLAIENTKKKILIYDLDGNFINEMKGIKEAGIALNINKNNITDCLKNRLSHIRNFRFFYYTENFQLKIESIRDNIKEYNKKVIEYEGGIFIKEYSSATEVSKILNIKYYTVHNILSGKTKKCREYPNKLWIYSD